MILPQDSQRIIEIIPIQSSSLESEVRVSVQGAAIATVVAAHSGVAGGCKGSGITGLIFSKVPTDVATSTPVTSELLRETYPEAHGRGGANLLDELLRDMNVTSLEPADP